MTSPKKLSSGTKILGDKVDVHLACGHVQQFYACDFPPKVGESINCPRCAGYRIVVVPPNEYFLKCLSCKYNRKFYNEKLKAQGFALRHMNRYPSHELEYYDAGILKHTYRRQEKLPLEGMPPF